MKHATAPASFAHEPIGRPTPNGGGASRAMKCLARSIGLVLLILSPAMVYFMPEEWTSRMETIKTYDQDESALGRLNAWMMAINHGSPRAR